MYGSVLSVSAVWYCAVSVYCTVCERPLTLLLSASYCVSGHNVGPKAEIRVRITFRDSHFQGITTSIIEIPEVGV